MRARKVILKVPLPEHPVFSAVFTVMRGATVERQLHSVRMPGEHQGIIDPRLAGKILGYGLDVPKFCG